MISAAAVRDCSRDNDPMDVSRLRPCRLLRSELLAMLCIIDIIPPIKLLAASGGGLVVRGIGMASEEEEDNGMMGVG